MSDKPFTLTDGDTFDDDRGQAIRVEGADTPENTPSSGMQPGGWQAKEGLRALLRDGYELGPKTGESYNRDVHPVYTPDGRRVSDELIRSGLGSTTGFSDTQNVAAEGLGIVDDLSGRSSGDRRFDELKESARRDRAANLQRILTGEFDDRLTGSTLRYMGEQEGTVSRAWDRGKAELRASGNAFVDVLGSVIGSERMQSFGQEGMQQAMLDAARNPANVASWEEVDGLADVGMFALESTIAEGPSLLVDAATGLLSGGSAVITRRSLAGVGKAFLRNVGGPDASARAGDIADHTFRRAAASGAFGSMYAQETGGTHMEQLGVGVDNPERALMVGLGKTTLEYASLRGILGDVSKRFSQGESVDSIAQWFGSTLATTATGAGREGVTELTQSLIGELNKVDVTDGRYELDPNRLIEGLVAGGAVGGSLGGAGSAVGNTYQLFRGGDARAGDGPVQEDTNPDAPQDLEATIEAFPDGIAYASPSNVRDGITEAYLREKFPDLHVKQTDNGGLKMSLSADAIANASSTVDEATMAQELGFRNNKAEVLEAHARGEEMAIERRRDERGRIVREELVIVEPGSQPRPGVERVSVEQNQTEREQRYRQGVEAARAAMPRQENIEGQTELSPALSREPTRLAFEPETLPADTQRLADEASSLGIDPANYVVERELTDQTLLARQLQGMLRETLQDDPNTTLRDALDGRRLSDLDLAQLEQVARAMGLKNLPKKVSGFRGETQRQRQLATSAVAAKLRKWKDNVRADKQGKFQTSPVPGDMSLFASVVPEVADLRRSDFASNAEYQTAVRDALPSQSEVRKRLTAMDDATLAQTAQLLGADNVAFAVEQSEGVDTAALRSAVEQTKSQGEGRSRNTVPDTLAERSEQTEADPFDGENILDDSPEQEADTSPDAELRSEAIRATGATALYSYLTGQTSGPGFDAVRDTYMPPRQNERGEDARPRTNPALLDGRAIFENYLAQQGITSEEAKQGMFDDLQAQALESPQAFAQGVKITDDVAAFEATTDGPARYETASASGVSNTRVQERGEQESADSLFFGQYLEGARFIRTEAGEFGPIKPAVLSSTSPEGRQRVKSVERTRRLKGQNLVTLPVRTVLGVEQNHAFDAIALAEYGQAGLPASTDARSALLNLKSNLQRMVNGPESDALLPGGERPSFVQSLRTDYFINYDTVIFEGESGPITYGEALRADTQAVGRTQEAARLGNELETLNEQQSALRKALTRLVGRIANGLNNVDPEVRAATLLDIGSVINNINSMPGDTGDRVAGLNELLGYYGRMAPSERAVAKAGIEAQLAKLQAKRSELNEPSSAEHTNAIQMATEQTEVAHRDLLELENAPTETLSEAAAASRALELEQLRTNYSDQQARVAWAKSLLARIDDQIAMTQRTLAAFDDVQTQTDVDLSAIDRRKSIAHRYTLTETEAERSGLSGFSHKGRRLGVDVADDLGGAKSFRVLADRYSAGIERAVAINQRLNEIGRVPSDKDVGVDIMAADLMLDGYQYDDAYAEAEKLVQRTWGMGGQEDPSQNTRSRIGDEGNQDAIAYGRFNEPVRGDFDVDGQPMQAFTNEAGEVGAAAMPTSDDGPLPSDEADPGAPETDPLEILRTVVIPNRARARALRQQVENYKAAGGKIETGTPQADPTSTLLDLYSEQAALRQTWVDGDATYLFQNTQGFVSPAHKAAFQKQQARKRVQGDGSSLPETPRADILNAAFGESGFRVIGATDPTAVESFVSQAVSDFRSTGRPVMITVGESADQISQRIQELSLLGANQRKAAVRQLKDAQAGSRALYMPMGDFVLVSLPSQPTRKNAAANMRWYHQLGHELGHMVFDDYASALTNNRTHREALFAAYTAQTELNPTDDPALFKEWFADQAANEMIERSLGMADPEQVTPFTRLANMMQGLWERIQYLLPRFTRSRSFAQFAASIRADQIDRARGFGAVRVTSGGPARAASERIGQINQQIRGVRRALEAGSMVIPKESQVEGGPKRRAFTDSEREAMQQNLTALEAEKETLRGAMAATPSRQGAQFIPTADFTIENYDGPSKAEVQKTQAFNLKAKAFAKKNTAPGTVAEAGGRLVRTVIGRIESYNPELAKRLFSRSATNQSSKGIQSWQHMANSSRDRWTGQMERTFNEVYQAAGIKGVFKGKEKEAALREAFRDFEMGRTHKKGAAALARMVKAVTANARQNGFRSAILDGNRPPVAMDHFAVDKDRQAFSALMREAYPQASEKELSERLNLLLDNHGQSEFAIAPGLPVSYHDTTRHMVDTLGTARLREAGFLSEPSEAVFYHFIDGLAKRTAWEANFGGYTRQVSDHMAENHKLIGRDDPNNEIVNQMGLARDGRYFDPNAEYHLLMDEVAAKHGTEAVADIKDMLDGVMGRKTSRMPRGLRNINDWATAWVSWTVLLFSGISSIPEIGLGAVRAHGRVGLMEGLRGYAEARRFAKDAGNVMSDSAERIMWQTMGDSYESSTLNKIGTAFFKLNGQKAITDVSRTMGISFGTRYLIKSAEVGDTQALAQLGVTPDDVRAWDQAGRPVWSADADSATNATAEKVQAALTQFMYEGSSYPSKFQNPGWFNNPYFKAFWMIKRYMYAYGEGILMGMWRQSKRQWTRGQGVAAEQRAFMAAAPFMAFAIATIPLAAVGTELREWMRPYTTGRPGKTIDDHGGVAKYSQYLFGRAGGFGPLEAILSARQQSDWGYSPIGSVSPVVAKAEMLFDWGADGKLGVGEAATKLRNLTPVASQLPGPVNALSGKIFD